MYAHPEMRTVTLRNERHGADSRHLAAHIAADGSLVIEGQDLGPATWLVSGDGEYEWRRTIASQDLLGFRALLDIPDAADLLDALEQHWSGANSHELERRLRESQHPSGLWTWSG